MIAVAILLFLFLIRRLHGGHENWSYIHFSRPPEPIGEALNDLPPISFAELEHFLPDSVENKIAILDVIEADTATCLSHATPVLRDTNSGLFSHRTIRSSALTKMRIEEYIDEGTEIAFFDRFYNWEVAAGSYIVKNTQWTQKFLKGFADYEFRLPKNYHGTDNGALHEARKDTVYRCCYKCKKHLWRS
ncbi:hypothetical protein ANCDUO_24216 [Ancylostoma duodenale]|uniref:Uncharacterized protein n=1 Tax=Ancylostoma duodenale TaxID=51022 RepID=A0A0C2FGA9_9BILA|nr:hypothetical protein ANCDUO_24216 [Ancylostoma duodenale]